MPISPEALYRGVLLDKKSSVKLRLAALTAIPRPSLKLLYRLAKDASPKIRYQVAQQLELELTRRALKSGK
jgi:hypothetical protein